jgi:hypothetical protein
LLCNIRLPGEDKRVLNGNIRKVKGLRLKEKALTRWKNTLNVGGLALYLLPFTFGLIKQKCHLLGWHL